MAEPQYDVIIVGAGPAGITAAITLAKANIPVLVLEGAVFPGAENWSGAVYFTEILAQPDVLGPQAVAAAAWERPVTKRGAYIYNGHSMVGVAYRNPDTFRHCYTVLRPTFDHYLAELAKSFGATTLSDTTVTGLIRDDGRIAGVRTNRGSFNSKVVFLAEGDASHLVTKEGYEKVPTPHFLQGICELIELPPDEIERHFNLPKGEGAAFEIILRNGSLHNRPVQLNMGGFIYTNAASVSVGLVLPLDNLAKEFNGDHNRLMEWFKSLPEVRRWAGKGRTIAYGAKIIRGGGYRELPQLVDNGLALGGACTGIGIDFPYPNFTGPATAMGRLFAQAVRQANGDFSRERLTELYETPLRQTHYFKNTEFLEKWPHYVEHTRVFFGRAADLACGSLYIGTHPELHPGQKLWQLAKFFRETLPPKHWKEFFTDLREQRNALGLRRSPVGAVSNRDLDTGEATLDLFVDGHLHRSFPNLAAKLRAAADHLYRNDDTLLPVKLHHALRSVAIARYLVLLGIIAPLIPVQWLCEILKLLITRPSPEKFLSSFYQQYRALVRQRTNLDAVEIRQPIEDKLALIRYFSDSPSHIKVIRPEHFQDRAQIADSPLWHVCPAKVYECRTDDLGQSQLIVNFENCIKCESCLRGAPADVDWVRDGRQRLIFSSPTEANRKLLTLLVGAAPRGCPIPSSQNGQPRGAAPTDLLRQFVHDVYSEPRYLDAGRAKWLIELLEHTNAPARALAHARQNKFFWAATELPSITTESAPPPPDLSLRRELDRQFPKQAIKDLEHGHRLTEEQITFLRSLVGVVFNHDRDKVAVGNPSHIILAELARKDVSLAVLVAGLFPADARLMAVPWIGLTAVRTHWCDFPAMQPVTVERVADAMRAIVLGAGEMLLERCQAHALNRVQFPGLFKDEDGHDGIIKFGAVKQLLSEMEAICYRLRVGEADAATLKVFASESFLTLTYNAGQIIGGSAFSEDDIFAKYYRDSACFRSLLFENHELVAGEIKLPPAHSELEEQLVAAGSRPRPVLVARPGCRSDENALHQPPAFSYRAELEREQHYDHCDFLLKPDRNEWRYVPEMLHADPELRAFHEKLFAYFAANFWDKRFDGQPYYRLVEKLHMIPLEHIRDMVAQGFMRTYIPQEFGGEGLLKAHYYILCPLSMRYADPSYALTIMAHSSIGTTPILLALNQDLPRAKADLQEFLADQSKVRNLNSKITGIVRMLDSPAALKVKAEFTALGETVKADIGKKPMLRALASDFLRHFMDAGRAGLRMDLAKFKTELTAALAALDSLQPRANAIIAELDRRGEAAKLFLRMISAGRISAFALTEPSAGSDSGGIQTRAELNRVEVHTDADGKYFTLGNQRRRIVEAATVDPANLPDCDVAQIRREDGREFYEYYELNGAKMWITNGHVAGVFCLYARTPEGPTGFLVRRDSEGLVVGKDEEKMGQRGSPTNELSLNAVRVPRENIIGIEGRGQVNALETLNVGRTGLCVTATAMIAKIVEQTRPFVRAPWQEELLGGMVVELFACESLAYELIGRFDHYGTKSARTESAIGKYYASEALHRVIATAERIIGIEAFTQLHELEKHRRDARVLNIYEGTNEVQRFLILRDLVDIVAPKVTGNDELAWDLKAAVETFGAQVWQNTNFQPTMFKLAEMAGYRKLIDSVEWRTDWLRKNTGAADATHREIAEAACARYVEFARAEIQRLHVEFAGDMELLKQGLYPPAIWIAMLATQHPPVVLPRLTGRTIIVANVMPVISPIPRVVAGELLETCFDLDAASRKLIATATQATVIAVGPRLAAERLANLPVAQAVLLQTEDWVTDPQTVARLVAQFIGTRRLAADRIVCADGLVTPILTGALGAEQLAGSSGSGFEIVDTATMAVLPKLTATYVLPAAKTDETLREATPEAAAELFRKLAGIDVTGEADVLLPTDKLPEREAAVLLCRPGQPAGLAQLIGLAEQLGVKQVYAVSGLPAEIWQESPPAVIAAGTWANDLLARWLVPFPRVQTVFNAAGIVDGKLAVPVFGGKVQRLVAVQAPVVVTFTTLGGTGDRPVPWVNRPVPLEPAVTPTLADAEFIIDVGYALRDREHFDWIVLPLQRRLEELGVKVMIGGTRKVVEELKLLAPTQQIGQTGTAVNPRVILSLGISGAPQHVDYIGQRATIIAFNKDASAPLLKRAKVVPVVGDLFETVPAFMAALIPATART